MGARKGVGHDYVGASGAAGNGQQPEPGENAPRVGNSLGKGGEIEAVGSGLDEQAALHEKLESFAESLTDGERALLLDGDSDAELSIAYFSQWSGLLPSPDVFDQYPEETKASIISWNNALIIDESRRADKLTDAAISQSRAELYLNFAVNVVFTVSSLVAFVATGDAASFGFLAIPAVTVAVNIYRRKKEDDASNGG